MQKVTHTVTEETGPQLREALRAGARRLQGSRSAGQDAELLLRHVTGLNRAALLTGPQRQLSAEQSAVYSAYLERRAANEPVQYILGEQEFYGLRFEVTPEVLIPRPETEHVVDQALALLLKDKAVRIADVGAGSGAIGVALACALPRAQVVALDISRGALGVCRRNAEAHNVADRMEFMLSDLLGAVADRPFFDAIVSNPPYIADGELLEAQVCDYEPHLALFAGPTGLETYKRLVPQAQELLTPEGWLLLEIGSGQKASLQPILAGWREVSFQDDLQGIPRVAIAKRPATVTS